MAASCFPQRPDYRFQFVLIFQRATVRVHESFHQFPTISARLHRFPVQTRHAVRQFQFPVPICYRNVGSPSLHHHRKAERHMDFPRPMQRADIHAPRQPLPTAIPLPRTDGTLTTIPLPGTSILMTAPGGKRQNPRPQHAVLQKRAHRRPPHILSIHMASAPRICQIPFLHRLPRVLAIRHVHGTSLISRLRPARGSRLFHSPFPHRTRFHVHDDREFPHRHDIFPVQVRPVRQIIQAKLHAQPVKIPPYRLDGAALFPPDPRLPSITVPHQHVQTRNLNS